MNPLSILWLICEWSMVVLAGAAVSVIPAALFQMYRNEREQWLDYYADLDIWIALHDTEEYQSMKTICVKCGEMETRLRFGSPHCIQCGNDDFKTVKAHPKPTPPKTQLFQGGRAYQRRLASIRQQRILAAYEQKLSLPRDTPQSGAGHS